MPLCHVNRAQDWMFSPLFEGTTTHIEEVHIGAKVFAPLNPYVNEKNFVLFLFSSG